MRSRVRRLGRAGTAGSPGNPVPGPLAAGTISEGEPQSGAEPAGQSLAVEEGNVGQTAPLLTTRSAPSYYCMAVFHGDDNLRRADEN